MTRAPVAPIVVIAVALLAGSCVAPLGTPTPSPVQTAAPSALATLTPAPTTAPTPEPTPSLTPATPTAPPPTGWHVEMLSDRSFNSVSMVVDPAGAVHAVLADRSGLLYMTNSSGAWTRERIGKPAEGGTIDRAPSIAVAASGALAVGYERSSCHLVGCSQGEIFVTRRVDAVWQEPESVDDDGRDPAVAYRDGVLHVAYITNSRRSDEACADQTPLVYGVESGSAWTTERVAPSANYFAMVIGPDGAPRIALEDLCELLGDDGTYLAMLGGDGFTREAVPGTHADDDYLRDLDVDGSGTSNILYQHCPDEDECHALLATRDASGWRDAIEPMGPVAGQRPSRIASGHDGTLHVASIGLQGVWYASNTSGSFVAGPVSGEPASDYYPLELTVASTGRPHLLFGTGDGDNPGELWYAVGPQP